MSKPRPSPRPARLRAGLALAVALAAAPALAQDRAIAVLLEQATYWKQHNRPDQVVRTLQRVLLADPDNAEALAGLAEAQALLGNGAEAQAALARLRAAAPADPRTARADVAVRTTTVDAQLLAQARQFAAAGRNAEAVERYRQIFAGGPVPDGFAVEYYQTLAGTEAGWREARDALAGLARRAPGNATLQLAYGQVLTYREETRAQGIEILRRLAGQPDTQPGASAAWRQALTWIGPGPEAVTPLEGYLQQFPGDAEIQRRLEQARNPAQAPVDEAGNRRVAAWAAYNAGRLRDAEQGFEALLAEDANDADGLGGLGLIRLRQGRQADARRLLEAAIAADPSRRADWERALAGASGRGGGGGAPSPDLLAARELVASGNNAQAEPLLARIVARNGGDRPDAEALLGDIALRQGLAGLAEQRYRAALSRRANFGAALSGLADALQAQGRVEEAQEIQARISASDSPRLRADALRAEAARAGDPEEAVALLRAAMQADPASPWPRLDLARMLARAGRGAEARWLMDEATAERASAEALHAAAIFAVEQGRPADAARLIERIPAGSRNQEQARLLAAARVQGEVQAAAALAGLGRRQEARMRLVGIAARPDATGEAALAAVRALVAIGDRPGAQQAARQVAVAARGRPPQAQLAAAGALMEAGLDQEAALLAQQLDPARLSVEQRRQAASLATGLSIRAADQLNRSGDQATAYDVLAPALQQDPQNPAANLALGRLYQGAGDTAQAMRIAEAVLARNPRSLDARQAALDAAIAGRDWRRAEALLEESRALLPGDPRVALLEARLARARGDQLRARAALEQAATLRRQQIGQDAARQGMAASSAMPLPQAGLPAAPPPVAPGGPNPFRRVPLAGNDPTPAQLQLMQAQLGRLAGQRYAQAPLPGGAVAGTADPLLSEIDRELREVREEVAPRGVPAAGMRMRSGDSGIDRLTEAHVGAEGSMAVPGLGGRLTARVSAVHLDSGSLSATLPTMRRFGSYPLTLPGLQGTLTPAQAASVNNTENAQGGIALSAAYSRPGLVVDIGTTPYGFLQQNAVGGIEIAPEIGEGVRLRLTAERRAMTDSLLSWGGARDPVSGNVWGGVVRTGGRAQLEFSSGETTFYLAGGYYSLTGEGVAENTRIEAGAGFQTPIWRNENEEIVTGLDLVYFAYDKNLRFFTLGHGGYFSPQSFVAANVPIDYRGRSGNLSYRIGATLGLATFTEDRAPVFPNDASLQGALQARANSESGVDAFFAGQTRSGFTGGLRGDIEYMITPQLRIGGALRFDQAADWSETRGLVYARYRFDR